MSQRFLLGGRLLAFGIGPYLTDAEHVSVEFMHPVIVGKRALPALDLSAAPRRWLSAIARPEDIVMGFGPPEIDAELNRLADQAAPARRAGLRMAGPIGRASAAARVPRPVHSSGTDRVDVPRAVGNGPRVLRATDDRRRRRGLRRFCIRFWERKAAIPRTRWPRWRLRSAKKPPKTSGCASRSPPSRPSGWPKRRSPSASG